MTRADAIRPGLNELWDLLDRYASMFSDAAGSLASSAELWKRIPSLQNRMISPADSLERDIREGAKNVLGSVLHSLRRALEETGLHRVLPEIDRLEYKLRQDWHEGATIAADITHLVQRLRDELSGVRFYFVSPEDAVFYGLKEPFGGDVASHFGVSEDAEAAGNCLALGQPTACVFHLMRVMECGVHTLGKALRVKFDPARQSWYEICNLASRAATNRAAKTANQRAKNAKLGAAVSHLQTVRLAWRNEVMHPKQTYTAAEAREVYAATRAFMMDLGGLV